MNEPGVVTPDAIPPIVLLVDDDPDTVDMYSTHFERSGVWVASAKSSNEAISAAAELKPDLIVTDFVLGGGSDGADVVRAVRQDPITAAVPIIVLTAREPDALPTDAVRSANLVLIKPVLPDSLLTRIRQLLEQSRALRLRSEAARTRTSSLVHKSAHLLERSARLSTALEAPKRACPACGASLEWLERGVLQGIEYDYYRWCRNGCGLFCFQNGAPPGRNWVKLA